jgi:cytoskeletal protein RodZ
MAELVRGRSKRKRLQLAAAYRQFSSSDVLPSANPRLRLKLLVLAVLVTLNVAWLGVLLSRAPGERAPEFPSTQSATPGGLSSSTGPAQASGARQPTSSTTPDAGDHAGPGSAEQKTIQLQDSAASASPFQPFVLKVRTAVEQTSFCGCSAGREASG